MPFTDREGVTHGIQLLGPVGAQGVEQPVPGAVLVGALHHGLVDEGEECRHDPLAGERVVGADPFRGGQVEGAGEHRQPPPQQPFVGGAQLVRPADRRAQGQVPVQCATPVAGEDVEAVVEPGGEFFERRQPQPYRSQFEGERNAVEPLHEFPHAGAAGLGHLPARCRQGGALREQFHGVVTAEGREGDDELAGHVQRLPTGGQQARLRRAAQQYVTEPGARLQEVLAGVQHDQQPPTATRYPDHSAA